MNRVWGNERGAVMIVVMMAIVLAGVLFGGLYVSVNASRNQAVVHQLQTQAEFHAQKMMEIALYHYYNKDIDEFKTYFADRGNCVQDGEDSVCIDQAEMILTAIGHGKMLNGSYPELEQTRTITYSLTDADTDTDTDEGSGTGTGTDDNRDLGSTYGEECEPQSGELPLRALLLGSDFRITSAMPDSDRKANPVFHSLSTGIDISGGLYVGNNKQLIIPKHDKENNKNKYVSVNIDGIMSPEGGLECVPNCNGNADTDIPGDNEMNVCKIGVDYKTALKRLYERYDEGKINSNVTVYKFKPSKGQALVSFDSAEDTLGSKKTVGSSAFGDASVKLSDVMQDTSQKVILVEGNLRLPSTGLTVTNGLLIVHNPGSNATSTIYMTDNTAWQHEGVIATEAIGRRTANGNLDAAAWPDPYLLSVNMTRGDMNKYSQP